MKSSAEPKAQPRSPAERFALVLWSFGASVVVVVGTFSAIVSSLIDSPTAAGPKVAIGSFIYGHHNVGHALMFFVFVIGQVAIILYLGYFILRRASPGFAQWAVTIITFVILLGVPLAEFSMNMFA